MQDYIIQRLRNDARHLLENSQNEEKVQHYGLRGRLRELLINNMLLPWLPPYVGCGTGSIISLDKIERRYTQDDIILFDTSLTPPILTSEATREGFFLFNSVLARIEVKSTVSANHLEKFCESSLELSKMSFSVKSLDSPKFTAPFNIFFAYKSDCDADEIQRLLKAMKAQKIDPLSGLVSMICIPEKGFWKLADRGNGKIWEKLNSTDPLDHIAWFMGCISNSCFDAHLHRQGRDPKKSLEMGIGSYIPGDCYSKVDVNI